MKIIKFSQFSKAGRKWMATAICLGVIGCALSGTSIVKANNTNEVYELNVDDIMDFSGYTEAQWMKAKKDEFIRTCPWYSNMLYDEKYEKIGGFKALYDELMVYFDGGHSMTTENKIEFLLLLHYYFAFNGVDRNNDGELNMGDSVAIAFSKGYAKYNIEASDTFIVGYSGMSMYMNQTADYMRDLKEKWGCTGEGMKTAVIRYYEYWTDK